MPLLEAIKSGHDRVASLLVKGALLNIKNADSFLYTVIAKGDSDLLRKLLSNGVDPNTKDYNQRMPLHVAATQGQYSIAKLLLGAGASVFSKDRLSGNIYFCHVSDGKTLQLMKQEISYESRGAVGTQNDSKSPASAPYLVHPQSQVLGRDRDHDWASNRDATIATLVFYHDTPGRREIRLTAREHAIPFKSPEGSIFLNLGVGKKGVIDVASEGLGIKDPSIKPESNSFPILKAPSTSLRTSLPYLKEALPGEESGQSES
ncbi:Potassium channel SKOR [Capsicum baccatum]|uniref:Potassium channel SKOR n=1 Tax=Capsicum baccatum TaxID=33114 RepID=A0A2G2WJD3_CAPBA|nr:Potassium channel SKOR [Capsicum baccatum]